MKNLFAAQTEALLLAIGGLTLSSCAHAPAARVEGKSSFAFIEPTSARSEPKSGTTPAPRVPVDTIFPAEPIAPLAKPVYPQGALGRNQVSVTVGVRITVDENGRVARVGPSLLTLSTPGVDVNEFSTAIEDAVAQWRFTPAEKRHLVPRAGGPGGEDYWVVTRVEKTDYVFDLAFTFTTTGDVLSLPSKE